MRNLFVRILSKSAERHGYRLDEFVWKPEFTAQRSRPSCKPATCGACSFLRTPINPTGAIFIGCVFRHPFRTFRPQPVLACSDGRSPAGRCFRRRKDAFLWVRQDRLSFAERFRHPPGGQLHWRIYCHAAITEIGNAATTSHARFEELNAVVLTKNSRVGSLKHRPDAILTVDGRLLWALQQMGQHIPDDIAVAASTVCDIALDAGINQNSEDRPSRGRDPDLAD